MNTRETRRTAAAVLRPMLASLARPRPTVAWLAACAMLTLLAAAVPARAVIEVLPDRGVNLGAPGPAAVQPLAVDPNFQAAVRNCLIHLDSLGGIPHTVISALQASSVEILIVRPLPGTGPYDVNGASATPAPGNTISSGLISWDPTGQATPILRHVDHIDPHDDVCDFLFHELGHEYHWLTGHVAQDQQLPHAYPPGSPNVGEFVAVRFENEALRLEHRHPRRSYSGCPDPWWAIPGARPHPPRGLGRCGHAPHVAGPGHIIGLIPGFPVTVGGSPPSTPTTPVPLNPSQPVSPVTCESDPTACASLQVAIGGTYTSDPLTATPLASGWGSVTLSPPDAVLNCPYSTDYRSCYGTIVLPLGTDVTLTATADPTNASFLSGWTGTGGLNCPASSSSCTVTIGKVSQVEALFGAPVYQLTIDNTMPADGVVSSSGFSGVGPTAETLDCGGAGPAMNCTAYYPLIDAQTVPAFLGPEPLSLAQNGIVTVNGQQWYIVFDSGCDAVQVMLNGSVRETVCYYDMTADRTITVSWTTTPP